MKSSMKFAVVIMIALILASGVTGITGVAATGGSGSFDLAVAPPDSSLGGILRLNWKVDDPSTVAGYKVYRSTSEAAGFKLIAEEEVNIESGNQMDHFDSNLGGGTYFYKVALVGRDGSVSYSNVAKGTASARKADKTTRFKGKRIVISVVDQRIYFLEDEVVVKSHLCSTGTYDHPTPEGLFKVEFHSQLVISELYGDAYCYWWLGFFTDTGMHALPYDADSGTYSGRSSLGSRASHGCVRQEVADAKWAYDWAPDGTRLEVVNVHFEPPPPPPPPVNGGHASLGAYDAAQEWFLSEGCTKGDMSEYVLMMNPGGETATVNATYMKPDGGIVSQQYAVPPLSRYTVHVDEIGGLEETEVSTKLNSDRPIAAERSMYFDYGGRDGGSNSAGVTRASNTWYLAEGYTGGNFDEFILLQNPGNDNGSATLQYMRPDGFNYNQSVSVGAHSRVSVHVDDIPELSNTEVSTMVTCNVPIVVERAQYFDYYGKNDGNASAGITSPSKQWYLAEGYTGGDFDTYVLIQNPGMAPGGATVTFMKSDGQNIVHQYPIKAQSRFSIHLDEIPGLENAEVSTFIDSDVDVIAERAMYFNSYGRSGGADAPGVPEAHKYWYLPEGYTGGTFDTFILVMNPNSAKTNIDVNFLLPNGGIVARQFEIAPKSRYTIHVDSIEGLSDASFSTAVTGDQPVICERAMYFSVSRDDL